MDFEVHCMSILPTELLLFNYDKVNSVLQTMTPLNKQAMAGLSSTMLLLSCIFQFWPTVGNLDCRLYKFCYYIVRCGFVLCSLVSK